MTTKARQPETQPIARAGCWCVTLLLLACRVKASESERTPPAASASLAAVSSMGGAGVESRNLHTGDRSAPSAVRFDASSRTPSSPARATCQGTARDWQTDAGRVRVQRCPGVPGRACVDRTAVFPSACSACPSCDCLGRQLCGVGVAWTCKGRQVLCMEP